MSVRALMVAQAWLRQLATTYWTLGILVELAIPIYLICRRLPRRPHTSARVAVAAALLAAGAVVPVASGRLDSLGVAESFVFFSALLAVSVAAILFCWDATPWQAFFAATAGYTLQNLQSGINVLIEYLTTNQAGLSPTAPLGMLFNWTVMAAVYVLGYLMFVKRINKRELIVSKNRLMALMFAVVVFMIIGLDLVIKAVTMEGISVVWLVLLRLAYAGICVFVLFAEYELLYASALKEQAAETERLLAERERQYRLSRENIEAINIKCHDIRHQIHSLAGTGRVVDAEALESIAHEVNVYDSVVETGNEALDTILTEKSLACAGERVVLAVIADGSALDFMAPSDIYSFFGNALDNALEAVRRVGDPEHRTITLNVSRRGSMAAVSCENYFEGRMQMKDGLPQTTKADRTSHGFGMRSMRAIAERYGGTLHVGVERLEDASDGGLFYLNALLSG